MELLVGRPKFPETRVNESSLTTNKKALIRAKRRERLLTRPTYSWCTSDPQGGWSETSTRRGRGDASELRNVGHNNRPNAAMTKLSCSFDADRLNT